MPAVLQTHAACSLDQLATLAQRLAALLRAGDVVLLDGDLGAGKTALVTALCSALGSRNTVTSPTYTIAQLYHCPLGPIVHLDAYRLKSSNEVWDLGYEEEMDAGLTLIEWGQKVADAFPDALRIAIEIESETRRSIALSAQNQAWTDRLQALEPA